MLKDRLLVFKAELMRWLILIKRYPIVYISSIVSLYIVFLGIFFGSGNINRFGPQIMADTLIGYLMWMFVLSAIGDLSSSIINEALTGTYEQLSINPVGSTWILFSRSITRILDSLILVVFNLVLITSTTGIRLDIKVGPTLLILLLSILGLYGFGFILASLALIFKRIGPIAQVLQYAFLFLTGAIIPLENFPEIIKVISSSLPLTSGIKAMQLLINDQYPLSQVLREPVFSNLLINSSIYVFAGILILFIADIIARKKGLLGQY